MVSRLHELYKKEIVPRLKKELNYENTHEVPRLEKIVVNMRIGDASEDRTVLDAAIKELSQITGQKPIVTKAKKSIANFGIKKGDPVGCRVTLRRERMYEFLDKLINVGLPRIRDFSGLKTTSFDGNGNYSLGLSEQAVFPELDYDEIKRVQGMDIIITIDSDSNQESFELLQKFGMPFKREI